MVHLLAGRCAAVSAPPVAVAAVAAAAAYGSGRPTPPPQQLLGHSLLPRRQHAGRTRPTIAFSSPYCSQWRSASSSSSSSPAAATVKQPASGNTAKGKAPASDADTVAGDDDVTAASASDADPGTRKAGTAANRSRAKSPAKKVADDGGPTASSSASSSLTTAQAEHERDQPAPNPSPAATSGTKRSDGQPRSPDLSSSWAEVSNPRALVAHLDSYVVGQTRAKKALSVAVYNHYVRLSANVQAKIEREELLMAEQWKTEREKERGLSRRLQDLENETNSGLQMSSSRAPRSVFRDKDDEVTDIGPGDSAKSEPSSRLGIARPSDRVKSARKSRSAVDLSTPPLEETRPARGAENILSDFIGQTEGQSEPSDRSLGYFSPNEPRLAPRPSRSPRSRPSSGEADVDTPPAYTPPRAQIQDERVRRALQVANARLDGKVASDSVTPSESKPSSYAERSDNNASLSSSSTDPSLIGPARARSPRSLAPTAPLTPPPFEKANILLLGPTGSGKSLLLRTLATALHVPFVHVDATPLTQAGYVGEDVESIVQRLLVAANWDADRAGFGIVCIDEVDKLAARRGLDGTSGGGRDVGGEGVQQALLRLLEGSIVTITDKSGQGAAAMSSSSSQFGGGGATTSHRPSYAVESDQVPPWWPGAARSVTTQGGPRAGSGQEDGKSAWSTTTTPTGRKATNSGLPGFSTGGRSSSSIAQSQSGVYNIDTTSVLFVLCGAFVGLEKIARARLIREGSWPADIDANPNKPISHEDREALLRHVEDVDLQAFGLIPEFVGRVPVFAALSPLDEDSLVRVLTEPKNSLVSQYEALFASSGVSLRVTKPALRAIAAQAAKKSTGARGLRRIMEDRLLDAMFIAPGSSAKYGLLDERAALGQSEVHLYSRGGKMAWLAAAADDDAREAGRVGPGSHSATSTSSEQRSVGGPRAGSDVLHSLLRRKSRTRLVRPSRLGHFRVKL
ncbi:hypothetical protein V8E36_004594 [Tilletia maclaganii]